MRHKWALALGAAIFVASCSLGTSRLASTDAELHGREIALAVERVPGGFQLRGKLRVAVPPEPLAALSYGTETLVRLFPEHVAGVGRWPVGAEDRFFFASKLFGRIFRAWGHVSRESAPNKAVVRWRTDKGAHGTATATRRGRGSVVTFDGYFPAAVDISQYLPGFGVELVLRVMAFAIRSRLEQLWRDGNLPATVAANEKPAAGIAPTLPWGVGLRVAPVIRR